MIPLSLRRGLGAVLILLLAACHSPLGLPEDYRSRVYDRTQENFTLPAAAPVEVDNTPLMNLGLERARNLLSLIHI